MKDLLKILFVLLVGFMFCLGCFISKTDAESSNIELGDTYEVYKTAVDSDNITFLSGETIYTSFRYVDAGTTYYYDFSDSTFKTTVVTEFVQLTEDATAEAYRYTWTPPSTTAREYSIYTKNNTASSIAAGIQIDKIIVGDIKKTIKIYGN